MLSHLVISLGFLVAATNGSFFAHIAVYSQNLNHIQNQKENIKQCSYVLFSGAFPGEDRCLSLGDYIECLLQKLNLNAPVSESNINLLRSVVNENLAKAELKCEVDVPGIVARLHSNGPTNRVPRAASPAAGYNRARNLRDCTHALTTQILQDGAVACRQLNLFFKCSFRVTGFYKFQFTDQEYAAIDNQLTSLLPRFGVQCRFDYRAIIADIAREHS